MSDEVSDEDLSRLLDQGRDEIARDPELSEKVRVELSSQMDDLVARILHEITLRDDEPRPE